MSENDMREIRRLLLEQSVKIEALALEVRSLRRAVETTEVLYVEGQPINLSELDDPAANTSALDILARMKLDPTNT